MNRKIFNYFKIAAKLSRKKKNKRYFYLGAIGIRSDGVMVKSANGPTPEPHPESHAEVRMAKKLDVGSTVYVARVVATGDFAMAKPCRNCERYLKNKGVKTVYYTIANNEFGRLILN